MDIQAKTLSIASKKTIIINYNKHAETDLKLNRKIYILKRYEATEIRDDWILPKSQGK